jgi:GTPase
MSESETAFHSGFAALIGRPNAGKSTLVNQLVGEKVAITSDKPQTTRNTIRGILSDQRMQVVLLDTPGVHKPKFKLGERMMHSVRQALSGCDIVLYLVDVTERFGAGEEYILSLLHAGSLRTPVFLVLNKIDLLQKEQLLPLIAEYSGKYAFSEVIPLSAKSGENKERLLQQIYQYLPQGPSYYPADMVSDLPEQMLAAELIREQVLRLTTQEIPHSLAVTVSAMEERENGLLYIGANLYVEHSSQQAIIIGKGGAMLKKIGIAARQELEQIFGCRCYLELRVKTKKDWRNNSGLLAQWLPEE